MRCYWTIYLLLFISVCSYGQTENKQSTYKGLGRFEFYQNKIIKIRMNEIIRTDSTYDSKTGHHIYSSFDKLETLVQELKYNSFQSDTRRAYLTRNLYNRNGDVTLYELFSMEGKLLEGFVYKYNENGLLTNKEEIVNAKN